MLKSQTLLLLALSGCVLAGCQPTAIRRSEVSAAVRDYGMGPNGFKQIGPEDVGGSFCLRGEKHIRELVSPNSLASTNHVLITKLDPPANPKNPCYVNNPPAHYLDPGDDLSVKPNGAGTLELQFVDKSGKQKFASALPLVPRHGNGKFTMMATDPATGLDYYVMLADDKLGSPQTPDHFPIEKVYFVEVFPSTGHPACDAERPDETSNVVAWTGAGCPTPPGPIQLGSGSGGHNYP